MIYDQDFRWTRRIIIALVLQNLSNVIIYAFHHDWFYVAGSLIWAGNLLFILRWNRQLQEERDQRRILGAALQEALKQRN